MARKKPMNHNEVMVGRYYPKDPKHLDTVMSWFAGSDGELKNSFPPIDSYLKPAFKQARRNGWVRSTKFGLSIMGSKPDMLWELTENGKPEAIAARQRVDAIKAAQKEWGEDWTRLYIERQKSFKEAQFAKDAEDLSPTV